MKVGSDVLMATWVGAFPMLVVTPPVATAPGTGLPVPPTMPLAKPAEATLPMSWPPGTPLATPAPKEVPATAPLRAAPAPLSVPGALLKDPTATSCELVEVGLGLAPIGSPKPPALAVGCTLLLAISIGFGLVNRPTFGCGAGATAFGGAGGSLGCSTSSLIGFGISGGG